VASVEALSATAPPLRSVRCRGGAVPRRCPLRERRLRIVVLSSRSGLRGRSSPATPSTRTANPVGPLQRSPPFPDRQDLEAESHSEDCDRGRPYRLGRLVIQPRHHSRLRLLAEGRTGSAIIQSALDQLFEPLHPFGLF
jgi:hypothetical protein